MFTADEIKRAHLIAKKSVMQKTAAGGFGKLEGNPNMWNMAMPHYNEAAPIVSRRLKPTFMQRVGQIPKGMYRSAMGLGAAATTGQKGSPGMLEHVITDPVYGVLDVWQGAGTWGGVSPWIRKPLAPIVGPWAGLIGHHAGVESTPGTFAAPFSRFRTNNAEDINMITEPFSTAARKTMEAGRGIKRWLNEPRSNP